MIELLTANTPNGKKISIMLEEIKFDYKVDKDLIGGMKVQLGSIMIDTSIKNKLKQYKKAMLEI